MLIRTSSLSSATAARRAREVLSTLGTALRSCAKNPSVLFAFAAGYLVARMVNDLARPPDLPSGSTGGGGEPQGRSQQHLRQLAVEPRATQRGQSCDPPLECAWSLDRVRTQLPSLRLYHAATNMKKKDKAAKEDRLSASSSSWNEGHYDEMSGWYEKADPKFLKTTGIVHFGKSLPSHVHVIPINGESYFRRSLRDADMILDGFVRSSTTGVDNIPEPQQGEHWLDFGGSHGRVAQILAAAYSDASWHVCDPIRETVEWAQKQLPRLQFLVMGQKPPLPYENETFAGVYALSIWSHYSEEAALAWFAEMMRILRPGGRLWFSTHGYQALNFAMLDKAVINAHKKREPMFRELYRKGHFYFPMFGTVGDWGVSDGTADGSWWGYGAFTAEWLAAKVLNPARDGQHRWRLEYYGPGVNERHQDVYVLSKV